MLDENFDWYEDDYSIEELYDDCWWDDEDEFEIEEGPNFLDFEEDIY